MTDKQHHMPMEHPIGNRMLQPCRENRMTRKRLLTLLAYLPDPVFAFTLDNKVEYVNPAFERTFGWKLEDIRGKNIDFIPGHLVDQAREGMRLLYRNRAVHDFETRRFTKDGRILDVLINGSILYDGNGNPMGQVLILRDQTHEKRMAKSNRVMFKISKALHQYHKLGDLIAVITKEIQKLISVEGAFILLADEDRDQLYFLSAQYRDGKSEQQFKQIRFAADQGVSGRVYKTGTPLMIPDVTNCSFFLRRVDDETDLETRNILSVPMNLKDRRIGVVSVVNKQSGDFDATDIDLLYMVASTIALPIENTRINEKLRQSYQELKTLNQAKDRVINHLAHELKTPVSVLGASMTLLSKKLKKPGVDNGQIEKIFLRGKRNLGRILDIQHEVEDLLRKKEFKSHHLLHRLLDACADELSLLFENETPDPSVIESVRRSIDAVFGPVEPVPVVINLKRHLNGRITGLKSKFHHRKIDVKPDLKNCGTVRLPEAILDTVVDGLIQNAVEYTPDGSRIDIILGMDQGRPRLTVRDFGIGITPEKQRLIFDNFFIPPESADYSTKTPFDFNAGGRGFDLLRIKLFSEQYSFSFAVNSKRCPVIPQDLDHCPGDVSLCTACYSPGDCIRSGGTAIHIRFA